MAATTMSESGRLAHGPVARACAKLAVAAVLSGLLAGPSSALSVSAYDPLSEATGASRVPVTALRFETHTDPAIAMNRALGAEARMQKKEQQMTKDLPSAAVAPAVAFTAAEMQAEQKSMREAAHPAHSAVADTDPVIAMNRALAADARMAKKEQQMSRGLPGPSLAPAAALTAADMRAELKSMREAESASKALAAKPAPKAAPMLTAKDRYDAMKSRQLEQ